MRSVLGGTVRPHQIPRRSLETGEFTEAWFVWTTRPHVIAERAQLAARERRRELDELEAAERERHRAAIAAKLARQQALTPAAVELVGREARGYVGVRDAAPDWAMGVPLFVHDMPRGVICPVVSRISAEVLDRFRGLTIFVATEAERRALARACGPAQRVVLFEVEIPGPAAAASGDLQEGRAGAVDLHLVAQLVAGDRQPGVRRGRGGQVERRRRCAHDVRGAQRALLEAVRAACCVIPAGTSLPVPDTIASHTNSSASPASHGFGRVVHRSPGTPEPTRSSTHAVCTSPVARAPLPAPADHGLERPSAVSPWRACPRVLHPPTGPTGLTGTIRGASNPRATGTPSSRASSTARAAPSGWLPPSPTGRRPGRSRPA